MKRLQIVGTALLIASSLASAQPAPQATPAPASSEAVAPPGLYKALGEKANIDLFVDDFVERMYRDTRIAHFFKDSNKQVLKESLAEQFCALTGGPCVYQGADMADVHADMKVDKGAFNALVEDLQLAMDAYGVAFSQQNRLLALLAPMHRDIITVR